MEPFQPRKLLKNLLSYKFSSLIIRIWSTKWIAQNSVRKMKWDCVLEEDSIGQFASHWYPLSDHTKSYVKYLCKFLSKILTAALVITWHQLNLEHDSLSLREYWFYSPIRNDSYMYEIFSRTVKTICWMWVLHRWIIPHLMNTS